MVAPVGVLDTWVEVVVVVAGILEEVVAMVTLVTVLLPGAFSLQLCHKGTIYIRLEILPAVGLICELTCKQQM